MRCKKKDRAEAFHTFGKKAQSRPKTALLGISGMSDAQRGLKMRCPPSKVPCTHHGDMGKF